MAGDCKSNGSQAGGRHSSGMILMQNLKYVCLTGLDQKQERQRRQIIMLLHCVGDK